MQISFIPNISIEDRKVFADARLYRNGGLFDLIFNDPNYLKNTLMPATVASIDARPVGICLYTDQYLFGWPGEADGIVGVYTLEQYRRQGIAKLLLQQMTESLDRVMGYTYSLKLVTKKINSEKLIQLG